MRMALERVEQETRRLENVRRDQAKRDEQAAERKREAERTKPTKPDLDNVHANDGGQRPHAEPQDGSERAKGKTERSSKRFKLGLAAHDNSRDIKEFARHFLLQVAEYLLGMRACSTENAASATVTATPPTKEELRSAKKLSAAVSGTSCDVVSLSATQLALRTSTQIGSTAFPMEALSTLLQQQATTGQIPGGIFDALGVHFSREDLNFNDLLELDYQRKWSSVVAASRSQLDHLRGASHLRQIHCLSVVPPELLQGRVAARGSELCEFLLSIITQWRHKDKSTNSLVTEKAAKEIVQRVLAPYHSQKKTRGKSRARRKGDVVSFIQSSDCKYDQKLSVPALLYLCVTLAGCNDRNYGEMRSIMQRKHLVEPASWLRTTLREFNNARDPQSDARPKCMQDGSTLSQVFTREIVCDPRLFVHENESGLPPKEDADGSHCKFGLLPVVLQRLVAHHAGRETARFDANVWVDLRILGIDALEALDPGVEGGGHGGGHGGGSAQFQFPDMECTCHQVQERRVWPSSLFISDTARRGQVRACSPRPPPVPRRHGPDGHTLSGKPPHRRGARVSDVAECQRSEPPSKAAGG